MPSRAAQDQDVVGDEHFVAVGIDQPLATTTYRDDAHADFHWQLDVFERAVRDRRLGPDTKPVRHFLGLTEIGDERGRDAQLVRDDARDVYRSIAHPLDRRNDMQYA